jgi:hypothetical protein
MHQSNVKEGWIVATAGSFVLCTQDVQAARRSLQFTKGADHGTGQSTQIRSTRILGDELRSELVLLGLSLPRV